MQNVFLSINCNEIHSVCIDIFKLFLKIKGSGIRNGRSCLLQTDLHHTIVEAEEPDDSEYGDATHYRVALYTYVVTGYPGHIEKLGYPGHIGELGYPGHIGELGYQDMREN